MQRDIGIRPVVLPPVERPAGLELRTHVHALRNRAGSEDFGRVQDVVAERVAAHAERPRVNVKDLVAEAPAVRPLIVKLQRTVVREAVLGGLRNAAPGAVIVRPRRHARQRAGRNRGSGLRLPDVGGRRIVDLEVLVQVRAVRVNVGRPEHRPVLERLLNREVGFPHPRRRIIRAHHRARPNPRQQRRCRVRIDHVGGVQSGNRPQRIPQQRVRQPVRRLRRRREAVRVPRREGVARRQVPN